MKKLVIDFNKKIIKTAFLEDGNLIELLIDNLEEETCVGNIYIGKVKNIFSNQFAFVDIEKDRNAFLKLKEDKEDDLYIIKNNKNKLNLSIEDKILVQVIKDKIEKKQLVVSRKILLTGHYLILKLNNKEISISQKIKNKEERLRLENICNSILKKEFGCIIRTEANNINEDILKKEFKYLKSLALFIINKFNNNKDIGLIYKENNIYEKSLKNLLKNDIDSIIINSSKEEKVIKNILKNYNINENILSVYNKDLDIFLEYEIEKQIEKALNKKVWLKSGGFLIIEKTEAFNVIDVNTGKFVSKKNKKINFILKTNLEAAKEIAKQIRLRNLSGIIIVDFIDMKNKEDKNLLVNNFSIELKKDRININIIGITELGLFQITRKKTRPELSTYFLSSCKYCNKNGTIYNEDYLKYKLYNNIYIIAKKEIFKKIIVNCNINIIKLIKKNKDIFNKLEEKFKIKIIFNKVDIDNLNYYEIKKE